MNKTVSIRLNETDLNLIRSAVEQVQIQGKDAKVVADCLVKIQKAEKRMFAPTKDSDLILDKDGQLKAKV